MCKAPDLTQPVEFHAVSWNSGRSCRIMCCYGNDIKPWNTIAFGIIYRCCCALQPAYKLAVNADSSPVLSLELPGPQSKCIPAPVSYPSWLSTLHCPYKASCTVLWHVISVVRYTAVMNVTVVCKLFIALIDTLLILTPPPPPLWKTIPPEICIWQWPPSPMSHMLSAKSKAPPVVTLCALLTCDLLEIAEFLII